MPNFKNTDDAVKNTSDIQIKGNPDEWVLIAKASSKKNGWMKSTKAMVAGGGVVIQVTSEHSENGQVVTCAEALTFVPGATIDQDGDGFRIV